MLATLWVLVHASKHEPRLPQKQRCRRSQACKPSLQQRCNQATRSSLHCLHCPKLLTVSRDGANLPIDPFSPSHGLDAVGGFSDGPRSRLPGGVFLSHLPDQLQSLLGNLSSSS
ncbi:hypothetical protein IF2G_06241 [Cordyceps javanica]|nr:hypothetical protein IF2G_06241 [Cordyceps javanica]